MRRFFAMFIDLLIIQIFFMIYLSLFSRSTNPMGELLEKMSNFLLYLFYNFVVDYFFEGLSLGKFIAGIKTVLTKDNKMSYSLAHGFFRLVSYILFPFTGLYYFVLNKGKVPYDLWFHTETINLR